MSSEIPKDSKLERFLRSKCAWYGLLGITFLSLIGLHFNGFSSNDFWNQAAVGRYIVTNLKLPNTGLFSFTVAKDFPFMSHEWLSSVVLSFIAEFSNNSGWVFAVVKTLIAAVSFFLTFRLSSKKASSPFFPALIALFVAYAISFRLSLRSENLIFILFPLHLILFEDFFDRKRWTTLILMVLNLVVWVNMHSSYPLVFVILGIRIVSEWFQKDITSQERLKTLKSLVICLLLLGLATLINPYGYNLMLNSIEMSSSGFLPKYISEWRPTFSLNFMTTPSFYIYVFYTIIFVILAALNFKKLSLYERLMSLAFLILSTLALRHLPYFFIATSPIFTKLLVVSSVRLRNLVASGILVFILAALIFAFSYGNFIQSRVGVEFDAPLKAATINWIEKTNISGPVFNGYSLGDQLIYNFFPKIQVVIDCRTDFYGEDYVSRYVNTMRDDVSFLEFIRNFKIKAIVVNEDEFEQFFRNHPDRLQSLNKDGWALSYRASDNVILTRP